MSPQDLVLELDLDIVSIASGVAKTYPSVVDKDDVVQELRLYVLEQAKWLDGYDANVRRAILRREAHRRCSQERTDAMHFSDQYHYTSDEVRKLVEEHVLGDALPEGEVETVTVMATAVESDELPGTTVRGKYITVDQYNQLAGLEQRLDIESALSALGAGQDKIYDYLTTNPRPGASSAERRAYDRAIQKLTRLINGNR